MTLQQSATVTIFLFPVRENDRKNFIYQNIQIIQQRTFFFL